MKKVSIVCAVLMVAFLPYVALAAPVPDTGQTKCYNATTSIPCPSPGEDFYRQDAQYITNPQSYTKLDASGNDLPDTATEWVMVRDNVTGLIWEVKQDKDGFVNYANPHDADNNYTWFVFVPGTPGGIYTVDFISALNSAQFGGYNDWRLPTIEELSFIRNMDTYDPAINIAYFPNTQSSYYWSSTTRVSYYPESSIVVYFFNGNLNFLLNSNYSYVRAVRGGQSTQNYIDSGDGTVIDMSTSLMWEVKTDDGGSQDKNNTYTWEEALAYCENLSLAGYDDWRLPNVNELQSLVDYSQYPRIDTAYFPNTQASSYWSSTTNVGSPGYAWFFEFYYGIVFYRNKPYNAYVRAVRGSLVDSDGDGIPDDEDSCPFEDATGLDANNDGCIDAIEDLAQVIETLPEGSISEELENSIISKVQSAFNSVDNDVINAGINKLNAFINEIEAQRGKKVSEEVADMLIEYAQNVIAELQSQL